MPVEVRPSFLLFIYNVGFFVSYRFYLFSFFGKDQMMEINSIFNFIIYFYYFFSFGFSSPSFLSLDC